MSEKEMVSITSGSVIPLCDSTTSLQTYPFTGIKNPDTKTSPSGTVVMKDPLHPEGQ